MPVLMTLAPASRHTLQGHPENAGRFSRMGRLEELPFYSQLTWLPVTPATPAEVSRTHAPAMLESLREASQAGPVEIDPAPTYLVPGSWEAALDAAGAALTLTRAIRHTPSPLTETPPRPGGESPATRGFALIRPPGHHAGRARPMGFCLLNNLAIAVNEALSQGLSRAAIIDFDGHHGNGTEELFWKDERVGYFSSHQEGAYPGSGSIEEAPHARQRIIHCPLPPRAGDQALSRMAGDLLHPWLERFQPEMLFISAGFDGHWADPLLSLGFTSQGFFELARELIAMADRWCQGRILFILEGGYSPPILAECVAATLAALASLDQPAWPGQPSPYPEPDIRSRLARVNAYHRLSPPSSLDAANGPAKAG